MCWARFLSVVILSNISAGAKRLEQSYSAPSIFALTIISALSVSINQSMLVFGKGLLGRILNILAELFESLADCLGAFFSILGNFLVGTL